MNMSDDNETIKMKATVKIITAAGLVGLILAACGSSGITASSSTPTTTEPAVPANATVGFNAAKTAFVLPYKLGLLPASELALAESNTDYAAGLVNPNDWVRAPMEVLSQFATQHPYGVPGREPSSPWQTIQVWYYVGSQAFRTAHASNYGVGMTGMKEYVATENTVEALGLGMEVLHSTSVSVSASTLNSLAMPHSTLDPAAFGGDELVAPSNLEVQAAPVGTLSIGGNNAVGFCVPTPEAYISGNKVVDPGQGMPVITAGPASAFAVNTPTAKSSPIAYDKGVASCANFH